MTPDLRGHETFLSHHAISFTQAHFVPRKRHTCSLGLLRRGQSHSCSSESIQVNMLSREPCTYKREKEIKVRYEMQWFQTSKYLCTWAWSMRKGNCTTWATEMPAKTCSPPDTEISRPKTQALVRNRKQ